MMIDQLRSLLDRSEANSLTLTVQKRSESESAVILNVALGMLPAKATDEQRKLHCALSMPLCITGDTGEVDVTFADQLEQYIEAVEVNGQRYNSLSKVAASNVKASKPASKSNTGASTSKKEVTASKPTKPEPAPAIKSEQVQQGGQDILNEFGF